MCHCVMCVLVQECVSALLSFPGVCDAPDQEGRTALMWAAQRGNHSVLKAMLERDVDVHATDTLGATGKWGARELQWHCSVMCSISLPQPCTLLPSQATPAACKYCCRYAVK